MMYSTKEGGFSLNSMKVKLAEWWKKLRGVPIKYVLLGAVIMVVGYSLGRAFLYATPAAAIAKLPYQILQALVGAALGTVLRWKVKPLATLAGKLGGTAE